MPMRRQDVSKDKADLFVDTWSDYVVEREVRISDNTANVSTNSGGRVYGQNADGDTVR